MGTWCNWGKLIRALPFYGNAPSQIPWLFTCDLLPLISIGIRRKTRKNCLETRSKIQHKREHKRSQTLEWHVFAEREWRNTNIEKWTQVYWEWVDAPLERINKRWINVHFQHKQFALVYCTLILSVRSCQFINFFNLSNMLQTDERVSCLTKKTRKIENRTSGFLVELTFLTLVSWPLYFLTFWKI